MRADSLRLEPGVVEAFTRDGAVLVQGVLGPEHLEQARRAIDLVLADPGPLALTASGADDPGRFVEDFCRWTDVADIETLGRSLRIGELAAALMGSPTARLYHDHVLVKEAGTRQRTPWHQDQPYYNVDGRQNVSFWIPVDPVPSDASLELLAGSHLGPWYLPRTFLAGHARWFPEGSLAELGDIEAERATDPSRHRILRWDLDPGDAIAFHMGTVHGSPGFVGPGRRRVLSLRYLGDDARHAPRPWPTSPPFAGLAEELATGAPFDHPLFPVVFPVDSECNREAPRGSR